MRQDLISRQTAIDAINTWDKFGVDERGRVVRWHEGLEPYVHLRDVVIAIEGLPSAQKDVPERIVGYWQMFDLITSAYYGKMMYSKQDNGIVYSRYSGKYMRMDEAINEFLALIGEERE